MGTEYTFVCEDCKKYYDISNIGTVLHVIHTLLKEHEGHSVLVYSDDETDLVAEYEGYSYRGIKTEYSKENIRDSNGLLLNKYSNPDHAYVWSSRQFYSWYIRQSWYKDVYFQTKRYTPEEHKERRERTAKSVQKFYETLDDDMDDDQETNSLHKHSNMQAVELSAEHLNKLVADIEKRQNDN